jgi:hypothetical protein
MGPLVRAVCVTRSTTDDAGGAEGEDEDEGAMSDLEPLQLDDETEEEDEEDEGTGVAPMSLPEAITRPIYPGPRRRTRRQGESSRCVLCPGKILQGEALIADHLASSVCRPLSSSM